MNNRTLETARAIAADAWAAYLRTGDHHAWAAATGATEMACDVAAQVRPACPSSPADLVSGVLASACRLAPGRGRGALSPRQVERRTRAARYLADYTDQPWGEHQATG